MKTTKVASATTNKSKTRNHTLYTYVKPKNGQFARKWGKQEYGSYSAYVDALIEKDRQRVDPKAAGKA